MLPTRQDVPNPLTSLRHNPASLVQTVPVQSRATMDHLDDRVIKAALRRIGTGGCDVADECIETQFPAPLHAAGTAVDPRLDA